MNQQARGLGRGLSALLGDAPAVAAGSAEGVREIDVAAIKPNPLQPRRIFSEDSLAELAESIGARGVLQPILVRPSAEAGQYEIVAGERRWRAAQRAQLHRIPAIVRSFDEAGTAEVALIENVQRADLGPLEEADAYAALVERFGHKPEDVGKLVGKSRSHIANLLRLRDLPESVRTHLDAGTLSMGHARAIASAPDPELLAEEIVKRGLSVRQAEALARRAKPGAGSDIARGSARLAAAARDADLVALERQLGDLLGLKVSIQHAAGAGQVAVHFSSLDQLDLICQRLSGEPI
ncbi:ParB/RepB/Spo0J family partition protein [Sphingomonas astaxanthinifaciens]|uniref:Chromosome partitioning protein ParB n=1 Tax=Sphingomonas astaxanthinifaciens DSM 22298 TaxID=1123267 RepID=A0ABQ5Z567_9SPHN|nr:ParB/RepB/Spo0J family partition protein [Sphingomonas astaxanthinifaciens]GLR46775.1 chromosome partitioning protein ParB [Sphingomonas astaxanthinifaciens DSM 22298]